MDGTMAAVHMWDKEVGLYEERAKKELDDDLKAGIVLELAPEEVRDHVTLNSEKYPTYAAVRKCIENYIDSKREALDAAGPDHNKKRKRLRTTWTSTR